MKDYYPAILSILIIPILFSCTPDEDELEDLFTNIEGIVKESVSCNTEGRGLAYGIDPENFELSTGFIITATLPEDLKQEGVRIKFDMKSSKKYITFCTANFLPEQFYEVFNVTILVNQ